MSPSLAKTGLGQFGSDRVRGRIQICRLKSVVAPQSRRYITAFLAPSGEGNSSTWSFPHAAARKRNPAYATPITSSVTIPTASNTHFRHDQRIMEPNEKELSDRRPAAAGELSRAAETVS